jgi:hypothetical protein
LPNGHSQKAVYYLPIWFQAIKGVSAVDSGIRLLPLVLSLVLATASSGLLISRIGYYTPVMFFGIIIMCVGAGLLTTLQVDTTQSKWIGYQVLYGFGLGCTFQTPNLAVQTVLQHKDVPVGTALMFFGQLLGGAIFISVGQNVLNNQLLERLGSLLPEFDHQHLESTGATTVTNVSGEAKHLILGEYNEALRQVFRVALILSCLSALAGISMEWKSVRKYKKKADTEPGVEGSTLSREGSRTTVTAAETPLGGCNPLGLRDERSPDPARTHDAEQDTVTTVELEQTEKRMEALATSRDVEPVSKQ